MTPASVPKWALACTRRAAYGSRLVASLKSNGMPAGFAEMMVALMVQFSTGAGAHVTPAISQLLGRPARSIDQFFADNIDAFR
jgi:hypothetical protein